MILHRRRRKSTQLEKKKMYQLGGFIVGSTFGLVSGIKCWWKQTYLFHYDISHLDLSGRLINPRKPKKIEILYEVLLCGGVGFGLGTMLKGIMNSKKIIRK